MIHTKINEAVQSPQLAVIETARRLNRAYYTRLYQRSYNPQGIDVFAEDWDNLLILDACRYDSFAHFNFDLPGELDYRYSRGSATREFIEANFRDQSLHDVVYVSANAWYQRLRDEINANVYKFVNLEAEENQDEEVGIELPKTVSEHALTLEQEHPNKRLVIHYMQPHYPYIGPIGRDLINPKAGMTKAILDSECSKNKVEAIYRENLEIVLDDIKSLLPQLPGKSVVTSDHGELIGDRSFPIPYTEYGHPRGTYVEGLVKVPWFTYTNGERKEIVAEDPQEDVFATSDAVDNRLRNLGYRM